MFHKIFKFMFFLFITSVAIQANANQINLSNNNVANCSIGTSTEPQYQTTFTLPKISDNTAMLVLRFYQEWGDGSSTGWQTSVNAPTITLDGVELPLLETFSYANQQAFQTGAIAGGIDQYAQYLMVQIPQTNIAGSKLVISGSFQQVAYMNTIVYNNDGTGSDSHNWHMTKLDNEFTTLNNACNPYIALNPSVFAYTNNTTYATNNSTYKTSTSVTEFNDIQQITLPKASKKDNGYVGVYRPDRYDSRHNMLDDTDVGSCSQAYLVAPKESSSQEVLVLRIKLPSTFINDSTPNKIFRNYQTDYFSISANVNPILHLVNPLGYWTVNAQMLKKYIDKDGYVYVFFAPNDYTNNVAIEQGTPANQPPVITWGKYKGYLLGDPDYMVIIRYKNPDPSWVGSPANAVCYNFPQQLKPLSPNELGEYTPEIYADTMDNFTQGNIGAVNMNNSWPKSH